VKLLQAEEEKMLRRIEETKSRAEKIFEAKQRHEKELLERLKYKKQREY